MPGWAPPGPPHGMAPPYGAPAPMPVAPSMPQRPPVKPIQPLGAPPMPYNSGTSATTVKDIRWMQRHLDGAVGTIGRKPGEPAEFDTVAPTFKRHTHGNDADLTRRTAVDLSDYSQDQVCFVVGLFRSRRSLPLKHARTHARTNTRTHVSVHPSPQLQDMADQTVQDACLPPVVRPQPGVRVSRAASYTGSKAFYSGELYVGGQAGKPSSNPSAEMPKPEFEAAPEKVRFLSVDGARVAITPTLTLTLTLTLIPTLALTGRIRTLTTGAAGRAPTPASKWRPARREGCRRLEAGQQRRVETDGSG